MITSKHEFWTDNRLTLLVLLPLVLLWGPAFVWFIGALFTTPIEWDGARLLSVTSRTIAQAFLSTAVSLAVALPAAIALHRRSFPGKRLFKALLSICFILPPILAAYAIIALWGQNGMIAWLWTGITDTPWRTPFGWGAVILGHAMLNLPFALRLCSLQLEHQPDWIWKTASELNLSPWGMIRYIDLPVLRPLMISLARLVFLYCMQSFAIVWLLGGGPGLTTLEVALFSALRQEANVGWALQIMVVQIAFVAILIAIPRGPLSALSVFGMPAGQASTPRPDRNNPFICIADCLSLLLVVLIVVAPLISLVVDFDRGAKAMITLLFQKDFYVALAGSLILSIPAAILGCGMSASFAYLLSDPERPPRFGLAAIPMSVFVVPFIALGSSWVLLSLTLNIPSWALIVVIVLALASAVLPLGTGVLQPVFADWNQNVLPTIRELRLPNRYILLRIAPAYFLAPVRQIFVWGLAFSIGDLGLTALFGKEIISTLPILMQRLFGSYHTDDGQGLALWVLVLYILFHLALFPNNRAHSK